MDLLKVAFASLGLETVKSSKDSFLQIECKDLERNDSAMERRRKLKSTKQKPREKLRIINLDEVAWHDTVDNCWMVIYDYVYDCTECLKSHPGGYDILLEYAGRDATLAFISSGHSTYTKRSLERYLIGELPPKERMFRVPDGLKIYGY